MSFYTKSVMAFALSASILGCATDRPIGNPALSNLSGHWASAPNVLPLFEIDGKNLVQGQGVEMRTTPLQFDGASLTGKITTKVDEQTCFYQFTSLTRETLTATRSQCTGSSTAPNTMTLHKVKVPERAADYSRMSCAQLQTEYSILETDLNAEAASIHKPSTALIMNSKFATPLLAINNAASTKNCQLQDLAGLKQAK